MNFRVTGIFNPFRFKAATQSKPSQLSGSTGQEPPPVTGSFRVSSLPVNGSGTVLVPNRLQRRGNHCQSRRTGDGARHLQRGMEGRGG